MSRSRAWAGATWPAVSARRVQESGRRAGDRVDRCGREVVGQRAGVPEIVGQAQEQLGPGAPGAVPVDLVDLGEQVRAGRGDLRVVLAQQAQLPVADVVVDRDTPVDAAADRSSASRWLNRSDPASTIANRGKVWPHNHRSRSMAGRPMYCASSTTRRVGTAVRYFFAVSCICRAVPVSGWPVITAAIASRCCRSVARRGMFTTAVLTSETAASAASADRVLRPPQHHQAHHRRRPR